MKPACKCLNEVNKKLEDRQVVVCGTLAMMGQVSKALVRTIDLLTPKARRMLKIPSVTVVANYCPFCGKKYPEQHSRKPGAKRVTKRKLKTVAKELEKRDAGRSGRRTAKRRSKKSQPKG